MHDQRMGERAAFELEDTAQGQRMARMRPESVDRLRRKRHQIPVAQSLHGGVELGLRRPYYSYHGPIVPAPRYAIRAIVAPTLQACVSVRKMASSADRVSR